MAAIENADGIRAAVGAISARLVALDNEEGLNPGDCDPDQVRSVFGVINTRLADLGDSAITVAGDFTSGPELAAAFAAIGDRLTALES